MNGRLAITIIAGLLSSGLLRAQPAGSQADQMDRPSNGVFEMTLSPIFPQVLARAPKNRDKPLKDGLWGGVVAVTIKNTSSGVVRCTRRSWLLQYAVQVFDSEGKPVPLTPFGEKACAGITEGPHIGYSGPISLTDLEPAQEFTYQLDLASVFQLKPGGTFTVRIKRSRDLPQMDSSGRTLRELSATLIVKGGPGGRDTQN